MSDQPRPIGERLFTDGFTRMPGGRARFSAVPVPSIEIPPGKFYLTTRRGKQFNSMGQGEQDFLVGSGTRRDVLVHPEDAVRIGVRDGDEVLLRSGPPPGTPVVTVGAPELLGAEYGVGEE